MFYYDKLIQILKKVSIIMREEVIMIIKVLIEISHKKLDRTFYYIVPANLVDKIKIGIRVLVPFASFKLEGFVLEIVSSYEEDYKLKEIIDVLDEDAILNEELLLLGEYLSQKTLSTLISCYQVMLPRALKARVSNKVSKKLECFVEIVDFKNRDFSEKQQVIIDYLVKHNNRVLYRDLKKINSSVDTLIKNNILRKVYDEVYRLNHDDTGDIEKFLLTKEQQSVVNRVIDELNTDAHFLLHGVTGSGKTEVYMEIIEHVLENGKQALVLVPEISLTPQIVKRFQKRFKSRIAILHSGLSDGEKYDEYRKILREEVDIVIGARSAVFAPFKKLGIIIIDECHSDTYKQDHMPKYDTLEIANYRSSIHKCPVLLGSATPTIDLYARMTRGYYKLLELKNRVGTRTLPTIYLADMMSEERVLKTNFSRLLYSKMKLCLERGEQVILLLNRRGYSSMISCKNCGYTVKCPSCDISLTYHKSSDILRCHYCGYATNRPLKCNVCNSDAIRELGTGTEKIEEEIKKLFPNYGVVRMDIDTTSRKGSHEKIVHDFGDNKYQILLGTQMIAKGLDFPNVTLVGVINADTSLAIPSYKSSENTFQLLSQVSGRSGRSEKPGEVVIQTFNPTHYAIQYAKSSNYLGFYQTEMKNRLINKYPPYFYLLNILIKSKDYNLVSSEANKIATILNKHFTNSIILGPTVAVPFKINNICRFSIVVKYKKEENLYQVLNYINDHYRNNDKINLEFSFNPDV